MKGFFVIIDLVLYSLMLFKYKTKIRLFRYIQKAVFIHFIFFSAHLFALKTDSIAIVLNSNLSDSLKIINALRLIDQSEIKEKTQANLYYSLLEAYVIKKNKPKLLAHIYSNWAEYYKNNHADYSKALIYTNKRIKIIEKLRDSSELITAYTYLGAHIYADMELIDETLLALRKSITYARPNTMGQVWSYYYLGWMEFNMQKYDSALVHLKFAFDIGDKIEPRKNLVEFIGWVGNAYAGIRDYKRAIAFRKEALKLCEENHYEFGIADCKRYLGQFYYCIAQYDSAIYYADYAFNYMKNDPANKGQETLIYTGNTLIMSCIKTNNLALGDKYVKEMTDTRLTPCRYGTAARVSLTKMFAAFYEAKGDNTKTVYYLKDYIRSVDSADMSAQSLLVSEQLLKGNFEKEQQDQLMEQQKKDIETEELHNRQNLIIIAAIIVLVLVSLLLFLSYKSGKQKKASLLEIGKQKQEIEYQKEVVEEKNKEIIESINYAKRLQEAILPPLDFIKQKLPESFIYYQPKDIVAGDFYWLEEADGKIFIAAADSTGHGVPGALVSIVCSNALNRSVKEFNLTDPGSILDKTRELVLETFSKSDSNVKDGMDISMACIDFVGSGSNYVHLTWAGANNPLWYINKNAEGNDQLIEIKGDKQSIGLTDNPRNFTTHQVNLQKGDSIFLFTDGFADQFGGTKGKKFKYKPLQELLIFNQYRSFSEQNALLSDTFTNWKGNLEQVDDVCIIGVRF
ncbi:MAG: SpoIIE family protein phosphatase [Burkholderiales bacterium]|nr:SpoIIE family protein phosphatase [Bacteroidia bacterium]